MPTLLNTFKTSKETGEGIGADYKQKVIIESGAGIVPIGAIVAWHKSLTGVPALDAESLFVECNGQVLSDSASPLDGQTIPDLNGDNRFMRGNATSGATGGTSSHTHDYGGQESSWAGGSGHTTLRGNTGGIVAKSHLPPNMTVVWIMRIK